MALRRPLYIDSNDNLRIMDEIHLDRLRTEVVRQYALDPSVILIFDSDGDSNTSIGTLIDTRLQAGAGTTDFFNFDTELETPEPSFVTVTWDKVAATLDTIIPGSYVGRGWPLYWTGSDVQSMQESDFLDTFVYPSINRMVTGSLAESDAGGTFFISTIDSDSAGTLINTLPVYTDTRADSALYTSAGIPETLDQPQDIQNYYLFRTNPPQPQDFPRPVYVRSDGNLQCYEDSDWKSRVQESIRETTRNQNGYKIRYSIDSASAPGANMGSALVNTRLSGDTGLYTTRFVNTNDYRTQEFPFGVPQTDNTYYLKARKE